MVSFQGISHGFYTCMWLPSAVSLKGFFPMCFSWVLPECGFPQRFLSRGSFQGWVSLKAFLSEVSLKGALKGCSRRLLSKVRLKGCSQRLLSKVALEGICLKGCSQRLLFPFAAILCETPAALQVETRNMHAVVVIIHMVYKTSIQPSKVYPTGSLKRACERHVSKVCVKPSIHRAMTLQISCSRGCKYTYPRGWARVARPWHEAHSRWWPETKAAAGCRRGRAA